MLDRLLGALSSPLNHQLASRKRSQSLSLPVLTCPLSNRFSNLSLEMNRFSNAVCEKIGFYVYRLIDPRNGETFYVGKGLRNRVFNHVEDALERPEATDKLDRIREIHKTGAEVRYEIIRHGLDENTAFEVEGALIDVLGMELLANRVSGHGIDDRGKMSILDIVALYDAQPAEIGEPSLLIRINRFYRHNISPEMLYKITRGKWVLSERRNGARLAFAVYHGIVREVYQIEKWEVAPIHDEPDRIAWIESCGLTYEPLTKRRWQFVGEVSLDHQHFVGKSTEHYQRRGAQSPITYLNC